MHEMVGKLPLIVVMLHQMK